MSPTTRLRPVTLRTGYPKRNSGGARNDESVIKLVGGKNGPVNGSLLVDPSRTSACTVLEHPDELQREFERRLFSRSSQRINDGTMTRITNSRIPYLVILMASGMAMSVITL
jgi:hypothetical protein